MTKDRKDSNQPNQFRTDSLGEKATGESSGEIPASEEELRFETTWKDMVARKRDRQTQSEAGNHPDPRGPDDPPAGKGSGGRTPS
jgi:hypothetical protein